MIYATSPASIFVGDCKGGGNTEFTIPDDCDKPLVKRVVLDEVLFLALARIGHLLK